MNVTERINRILFILTYVSKNPGVPVDELAERVGMKPRQLLKELEFILLIGKPPFRPDDYVDIYVEDQRVYVEFDQMLNRPLRLTRPEAMALLISLQLLDPEVDPQTVESLKNKIEEAITRSVDAPSELDNRILLERPSRPVSRYFHLLRQAIESVQKVRIEYYSLTRDTTTRRVVRPYLLMKNLGYWYLTGYCEMRRDIRTFKFERILEVELLEETFQPPTNWDVEQYKEGFPGSMGEQKIQIRFAPPVAPWIREQWGKSTEQQEDGSVILTLFSETLEYPSRLVLSFLPHARPLSPPSLIRKVREDARAVLEMYERSPVS